MDVPWAAPPRRYGEPYDAAIAAAARFALSSGRDTGEGKHDDDFASASAGHVPECLLNAWPVMSWTNWGLWQERILLLTDRRLIRVKYDFSSQVAKSAAGVAFSHITAMQRGVLAVGQAQFSCEALQVFLAPGCGDGRMNVAERLSGESRNYRLYAGIARHPNTARDIARRSSAEHLIATKTLRCTAAAWFLIVAQCSAIP